MKLVDIIAWLFQPTGESIFNSRFLSKIQYDFSFSNDYRSVSSFKKQNVKMLNVLSRVCLFAHSINS